MNINIITNLIAFVIISFISLLVYFLLSIFGNNSPDAILIAPIAALLILFFLGVLFRKRIKALLGNYLAKLIFSYSIKDSKNLHGLEKIYSNFNEAKPDILDDFDNAKNVKIFIQLGKGIIGEQRGSLLYESAKKKRTIKDFKMQILFASASSESLSKQSATTRGNSHEEYVLSLEALKSNIINLNAFGVDIEYKVHTECYLWKFLIVDSYLYLIPYLYNQKGQKNDENAPVFKFHEGEASFYKLFVFYFENVWKNSTVPKT